MLSSVGDSAEAAAWVGREMLNRAPPVGIAGGGGADAEDAGGATLAVIRTGGGAGAAGGAGAGAGAGAWGGAMAGSAAARPNSRRIISLTAAEESRPHCGQTNWIGLSAISGVTSNEYFTPQEH